ncbi:MAG: diphthine synthase [Candidatus Woesearchaeota archaeon]|nr:diphthine synthase [Candidatus Woesearchaeota archaeon]
MTLYIIGIGLNDEKDITLKGLETVKKCKKLYLDIYTSKINCSVKKLENLYKKKITLADRDILENKSNLIVKEAKKNNIGLLVIGAPLAATTHVNFILECKKNKVKYEIIENASIYSAVGITGLFLYKFGRTSTIPLDNENVKSCYEVYEMNNKNKLHTLFLLDIKENRLMTINEGVHYLIRNGLNGNVFLVGCSALDSKEPEIVYSRAKDLLKYKFKKYPQCLIVPSELHFMEEEVLNLYKK